MTETETYERRDTDIDLWFSLSYANYLVLHRTILQSAPKEWQYRFTAIMDELYDMFGPGLKEKLPDRYDIRILAREREWVPEDCGECEGRGTVKATDGTTYADTGEPADVDCEACQGSGKDYDGDQRLETAEEAGIIEDPIPHYNRTRTQLDFETGEEIRYCNLCKGRHVFSAGCPTDEAS